jgi:hypothetical protein
MALIMRDSIDARAIPADTPVVAGYGDGAYIWSPSWIDGSDWWALFPRAAQLVIVVSAAHQGDVLDVEQGDATPQDVPGWIDRFNRPSRRRPTIYCNRSTIDAVRQAAGGRAFDWWAATLDGTQQVAGAVAVQYVDTGAYDESIIWDAGWLGLPVPQQEETDMLLDHGDGFIWLLSGSSYTRLNKGPDEDSIFAAGVRTASISVELHNALVAGSTQALVAAIAALGAQVKLTGTFNLSGSGTIS